MAKRKNPLKDLDAFLKQEATSFVNPEKIQPEEKKEATPEATTPRTQQPSREEILSELQALANREGSSFRHSFYGLIRETLENLDHLTAEDKMLINTVLYLDDKQGWKENIKSYWQKG